MITFQQALDAVYKGLNEINYPEQPDGLYAPARYILSLKGKKIRPVLTLLACNLYQEDISDALPTALAWEIFHNFTLMHDDLMDKADVRRGQATVHKEWNENTAILSGDAMLILAYQQLALSPSNCLKELLDLFSVTAMEICEGQQYDMDFESRLDVTETEYLEMIRLKTAVLLGAALKSGAILGGADSSDATLLSEFGINLGLAFQVMDDYLDVYGDPAVFGKKIGGDILCNKKTFFLVNALVMASENERKELLYWLEKENPDPQEKIQAISRIYRNLDLETKAKTKMNYFYDLALNALSRLHVAPEKRSVLGNLASQLLERES